LPSPSFFFHGQEDLRKGIDTEGQVLEPLECGDYWILLEILVGIKNEGLVRGLSSMPVPLKGGRSKASPTRPSVISQGQGAKNSGQARDLYFGRDRGKQAGGRGNFKYVWLRYKSEHR
jgi:hypothetical protein